MSEAGAAETPPDDTFPMWEITKTAYNAVFGDLKHVYLLAWKPFLAAVVFGFVMGFSDGFLASGFGQAPVLAGTLGVLGGYWSNAYFALAFHRFQLFGWTAETSKVRFRLGRAEAIFLLVATFAYVVYGFLPRYLAMSDANFTYVLWIFVAVLGLPLSIMFSLAFPAAAAGHPHPLAQAGRWAKAHGGRSSAS